MDVLIYESILIIKFSICIFEIPNTPYVWTFFIYILNNNT